jgi:two-component system, NtrC family, sensor kinase
VEIVLRAVADPSVHWVVRERAEIGRLRELDVSLQDASISKLHAIVERVGSGYVVADLGSKNGTRLNGIRVEGTRELTPGDRLQFGSVELEVEAPDEDGRAPMRIADAQQLLRLGQALLLARNLDEVLRVALDQFVGLTLADRGAILLLDNASLLCSLGRRRTAEGQLADLPPEDFLFTETLAWSVVEAGRSRIVLNAASDEMLAHALSVVHLGVTGAVCVPLLAPQWGGGVKKLGVLYGDSVRAMLGSVPLDLLESIGGLIALAIESSRTQSALRNHSALLEERVQERTRELELKHRQLLESEKMAATGMLAAGVAHELGNAIVQVSANAELIGELAAALESGLQKQAPELLAPGPDSLGELVADLKEASGLCRVGAEMGYRTVRDLKSFARLDEAKVKLVSLDEAFEIVSRLVEKGAGRAQRFEVQLARLPKLWCYPELMNQVFLNLLVNAVQASKPGGRIRVGSGASDGELRFTVEDEGSGIAPDVLGRIFDPFFTTKKIGEGSGLGLALAYQIVSEHGGRIEVDTAECRGSRFTIVLPRVLQERPPAKRP